MNEQTSFSLETFLEENQKNIADLIGQEISTVLLANLILENPQLEDIVNSIFQKIYINIYRLLRDSFLPLAEKIELPDDTINMMLQHAINENIIQKKEELWETVNWLEKIKK